MNITALARSTGTAATRVQVLRSSVGEEEHPDTLRSMSKVGDEHPGTLASTSNVSEESAKTLTSILWKAQSRPRLGQLVQLTDVGCRAIS